MDAVRYTTRDKAYGAMYLIIPDWSTSVMAGMEAFFMITGRWSFAVLR